jgi:hypothetical protein
MRMLRRVGAWLKRGTIQRAKEGLRLRREESRRKKEGATGE